MPHLQIEINKPIDDDVKVEIANRIKTLFSQVMDTGTGHIATTIREYETYALDIGRVKNHGDGVSLINADIREGRTLEQKRQLALGLIQIINDSVRIPKEHIYVTLTEHKGEDFHLNERQLSSWRKDEKPLG